MTGMTPQQHLTSWLASLQPGDEVMMIGGRDQIPVRREVKKVHKLHIILEPDRKFRRDSGREASNDRSFWSVTARIEPIDEARLAAHAERVARSRLEWAIKDAKLETVSLEDLRTVAQILGCESAAK